MVLQVFWGVPYSIYFVFSLVSFFYYVLIFCFGIIFFLFSLFFRERYFVALRSRNIYIYIYTKNVYCQKIEWLYVRDLETDRKVSLWKTLLTCFAESANGDKTSKHKSRFNRLQECYKSIGFRYRFLPLASHCIGYHKTFIGSMAK